MDEWLTVKQVAEELGTSVDAIYQAIRRKNGANRLESVKVVGMGVRIHREEMVRFRQANLCPVDLANVNIPAEPSDA